MRRVAATFLVLGGLLVSCSGGQVSEAPPPREHPAALEFAVTARRALADTRFEALGDEWLAGLVVKVCAELAAGSDPDGAVTATIAAVDAPPGLPVDDEILAEVLTAGVADVCPNAVLEAGGLDPVAAGDYLGILEPIVEQAGLGGAFDEATLLSAGLAACATLDGGSDPGQAGAAVLRFLFGVEAPDLAALEESGLGPREGIVAGGVLGAAVSTLCPSHAEQVAGYVSGVSA